MQVLEDHIASFAFSLAGGEIVLILALVLILFGAKHLPGLGRGLGRGISEFRKGKRNLGEGRFFGLAATLAAVLVLHLRAGAPEEDIRSTTHMTRLLHLPPEFQFPKLRHGVSSAHGTTAI
jgi:sec-independent protein translocase protein TatA